MSASTSSLLWRRLFLAGMVIYLAIALSYCKKMHVSLCLGAAAIAIGTSGRPGGFPRVALAVDDVDAKMAGKGEQRGSECGCRKNTRWMGKGLYKQVRDLLNDAMMVRWASGLAVRSGSTLAERRRAQDKRRVRPRPADTWKRVCLRRAVKFALRLVRGTISGDKNKLCRG